MVRIFISYSHADEELRRHLDVHLTSLQRQRIVDVWHDRRIGAGEDFASAIDAALASAQIILLLVSPDFIASAYCYEIEMQEALRRHDAGEAIVIPVIARACDWKGLPFGRLRATPTDGKPIRLFPDLDSAFLEVIRDVKAAAERLGASAAPSRPEQPADMQQITERPRSGNLRVRGTFTDFDRHRFRSQAFEYIARYFENSLMELVNRNPGIRQDFHRIDATAFEAALYDQGGRRQSVCGIWLSTDGRGPGEIAYSANGVARRKFV